MLQAWAEAHQSVSDQSSDGGASRGAGGGGVHSSAVQTLAELVEFLEKSARCLVDWISDWRADF